MNQEGPGRLKNPLDKGYNSDQSFDLNYTLPKAGSAGKGTGKLALLLSWEGLGVGSWSRCLRKSERRLSLNHPSPDLRTTSPREAGRGFSRTQPVRPCRIVVVKNSQTKMQTGVALRVGLPKCKFNG